MQNTENERSEVPAKKLGGERAASKGKGQDGQGGQEGQGERGGGARGTRAEAGAEQKAAKGQEGQGGQGERGGGRWKTLEPLIGAPYIYL